MFIPPSRGRIAMPTITPYGEESVGLAMPAAGGVPASGTWATANKSWFYPVRVPEPYTVSRAFWCNGATVGTDSIDLGIYLMTDLSAGRMDLVRSTGATLSAGSANVVQEVTAWKVARTNITASFSDTDATSYTTASVTLKAGRLYIMTVQNSKASADVVSAITGGPTFTAAPATSTTQYNGTANRISLWSAVPTVDYTGTLVIDFGGGNTQTSCIWSLNEFSGVDTSTTNGIVQCAVGTGNSTTPLATLAAFGSANNASFGGMASINTGAHTAGTNFTQLSTSASTTPAARMSTEWYVGNDTTVDATVTSSQWGAVACEIKADASSFIIPPSLPGNPNVYMAMAISGTTATVFRTAPSLPFGRVSGGYELTSNFPLPSTCTPVAITAVRFPLAGFSNRSLLG